MTKHTILITGLQSLTHEELADNLAEALGRRIAYREMQPSEAAAELFGNMLPKPVVDGVPASWKQYSIVPESTTDTVKKLVGKPPATKTGP